MLRSDWSNEGWAGGFDECMISTKRPHSECNTLLSIHVLHSICTAVYVCRLWTNQCCSRTTYWPASDWLSSHISVPLWQCQCIDVYSILWITSELLQDNSERYLIHAQPSGIELIKNVHVIGVGRVGTIASDSNLLLIGWLFCTHPINVCLQSRCATLASLKDECQANQQ